jgi:hypothetical protein
VNFLCCEGRGALQRKQRRAAPLSDASFVFGQAQEATEFCSESYLSAERPKSKFCRGARGGWVEKSGFVFGNLIESDDQSTFFFGLTRQFQALQATLVW